MSRRRVLIGGIYHETHTFLDGSTGLHNCNIADGPELLAFAGDRSPMAGAIASARHHGWEIVPSAYIRAMPGPLVENEVVDCFRRRLESAVRAQALKGIDGVFLVLHGAMVSESLDDVEGHILSELRRLPGMEDVPVCGVLDLHANFSGEMAAHSDCLVAYRENPHIDAEVTAVRAAGILERLMRTGERPATVWQHPPIMLAPTATDTSDEPLASIEALARTIERENDDILAVNVMPGFAFADTPDTGVSFTAVTVGDRAHTESQLRRLDAMAVRDRAVNRVADISVCEAMRRLRFHSEGPVVLVEPSDNIGAGAPGDCTGLLRALIEHDVDNAAVVINDPEAVRLMAGIRPGSEATLSIGGKGSHLDPGPVRLDVTLLSTSDGQFTLEDPKSHLASMCGAVIDMGSCAVVHHKGLRILLTSRKTPPFDLAQLRSQGIIPEELFAVVVKAAVAHRRAYDPIASATYWVDTPGPCSNSLRTLPYRKVRRPMYPLD